VATETRQPSISEVIFRLLGKHAVLQEDIVGGRNSRVCKVRCDDSNSYAIKFYVPASPGQRDRLETEYSAAKLMWDHGIRCIPEPIAADPDTRCAVYRFIEGDFVPREVGESDIDQAVDFLELLRDLSQLPESEVFPIASEAFLSVQVVCHHIEDRLDRLSAVSVKEEPYILLRQFLKDEFAPVLHQTKTWCMAEGIKIGWKLDREIGREKRTFSPSDFGFHNALKDSSGRLVFLDFEHFGWDDPAKLIADFLLHPHESMNLDWALKKHFFSSVIGCFTDCELEKRIRLVLPLFALKWCMILLNEFVPDDLHRRELAQGSRSVRYDLQLAQLSKARTMLEQCRAIRTQFPYKELW
jgi:hypothetical protein